ncbi:klaroid [Carabus blaptoides fortunei]
MISLFYFSELKHEIPNVTRKLTAEPKPYYFKHHLNDICELQRALHTLQEKVEFQGNHIKMLQGLVGGLRSTTKQHGGYVNAKQVKTLFNEALQVYDADKMGMQDYALLYMGADILGTPNTIAAPIVQYNLFGLKVFTRYSQPTELLRPDVNPGRCFAFVGNWGRVQILLSQRIFVKAVTMEHTHKSIVGHEIRSAPKTFVVYGLYEKGNTTFVKLGVFNYSIVGPARQTFVIPKEKQLSAFDYVELRILSNHGRVEFTCVYRFRVHGEPSFGDEHSVVIAVFKLLYKYTTYIPPTPSTIISIDGFVSHDLLRHEKSAIELVTTGNLASERLVPLSQGL